MDDDRVWNFEESLWTGDAARYHELMDEECLVVLPIPPFVLAGRAAMEAVSDTPHWERVSFSHTHVSRPQEGLIVIAYQARAERADYPVYEANCTSTYRRLSHDVWRVVQHQQTPPLVAAG